VFGLGASPTKARLRPGPEALWVAQVSAVMDPMAVYVGTSGWVYSDWRGEFYPKDLRKRDELAYYAERFGSVEINSTFYGLPKVETLDRWASSVPVDFLFAPKVSRYLSHMKRLKEPDEPMHRFLDRMRGLGARLGPALLQLPATLPRNEARLRDTLECFRGQLRVAVEFRHASWFHEAVLDVLREHNVALCVADRDERFVTPRVRTADWGYMRFHWGRGDPESGYRKATLRRRAKQLAEEWGVDEDLFVYFNNDPHGCAVRDAAQMGTYLEREGLRPVRMPRNRGI
jgi:uncharacterized protein YecE (DUF72 family)